mmetsp:Transcript_2505/g.3848  ORF Transcript_2505/g.3848 Transcript_2505/m.3848 type:complete len:1065 (+) Transcript_2505:68-3262(+)|eukprot:CAMPEP_0185033562 /NCGR_PEP_ID=MMETSP1103-20130426/22618_1 /TAXON_ID=36769 /ORGANISM="Paraphysomonas bandaiensis, Strain Caron Lab Isolate" /LENGTH=1064 /DNA_ID=CAMNT_0027569875 /DNA_START=33 /DNA_END=3227 /DNA_ORIENTATION=-
MDIGSKSLQEKGRPKRDDNTQHTPIENEDDPLLSSDRKDHIDTEKSIDKIGDGVISTSNSKTPRLRRNRRERDTKNSTSNRKMEDDVAEEKPSNREREEIPNRDKGSDDYTPKVPETNRIGIGHGDCCLPMNRGLSSVFACVGLGYRLNDPSERKLDQKLWRKVIDSKAFDCVKENCFSITIGGLSDLQGILGSAVKPFVKIHIVDADTGLYAGVSGSTGGRVNPVTTRQAQLSGSAFDVARWDEEIVFPTVRLGDVVSPRSLVLFEILDDPPKLSLRRAQAGAVLDEVKKYTRLAWAFLLPVGQGVNVGYPRHISGDAKNEKEGKSSDSRARVGTRARSRALGRKNEEEEEKANTGDEEERIDKGDEKEPVDIDPKLCDLRLRLQLYEHQTESFSTRVQRAAHGWPECPDSADQLKTESPSRYPDSIPEVYLQYRRKALRQMSSIMEVQTGYRIPVDGVGRKDLAEAHGGGVDDEDQPRSSQAQEDLAKSRLKASILKRTRAPNEPCVLPNKLLHRVDVGKDGAMVVSFSHKGHLLAVAAAVPPETMPGAPFSPTGLTSPFSGCVYAVRLYDPDTGVEVWSDNAAHFGVIYDLKWSMNDGYLLSCSSDGQCKVWRMSEGLLQHQHSLQPSTSSAGRRGSTSSPIRRASNPSIPPSAPQLVSVMAHTPPVYVYTAVFQEYGTNAPDCSTTGHAKVVSGGHDGRLRVWSQSDFVGDLTIGKSQASRQDSDGDVLPRPGYVDVPHMGFMVQALAIDVRSKYMFSGDSGGNILIWRPDNSDWYQLLRKFKKDDLCGRSICSMTVYPDKAKGYLLVLARPSLTDAPNASDGGGTTGGAMALSSTLLKMYDLGTYRAQHNFHGATVSEAFSRATFSADGRYAICGCVGKTTEGLEKYYLGAWDSQTGTPQQSNIAGVITYPYLPRCVSWHPSQHMMAVAMVGCGAAVGIYCANKDRAENAARQLETFESSSSELASDGDDRLSSERLRSSSSKLSVVEKMKLKVGKKVVTSPSRKSKDEGGSRRGSTDDTQSDSMSVQEKRAARTMEILERIRAVRAKREAIEGKVKEK